MLASTMPVSILLLHLQHLDAGEGGEGLTGWAPVLVERATFICPSLFLAITIVVSPYEGGRQGVRAEDADDSPPSSTLS